MRHDDHYLKMINQHIGVKKFEHLKQLPFFFLHDEPEWAKAFSTPDDKDAQVFISKEIMPKLLPFNEFTLIFDDDPCLHHLKLYEETGKLEITDYFEQKDYDTGSVIANSEELDSEFRQYLKETKFFKGIRIIKHSIIAGAAGSYSVEAKHFFKRKLHKEPPVQKIIGDVINPHYMQNMQDFYKIMSCALNCFMLAEERHQRLVRVVDAPKPRDSHVKKLDQKKIQSERFRASHHYVYLDGPPAHVMEENTPTGRTVRGHHRRAHYKRLMHPRYKNHPQYQQLIRVKATWVGPLEWADDGKIYTVHNPEDKDGRDDGPKSE